LSCAARARRASRDRFARRSRAQELPEPRPRRQDLRACAARAPAARGRGLGNRFAIDQDGP
jgi:hypothetical protein